ncbi:hypothetical protein PSENEW3_00002528 [Picochlorum sp. SENEW3]|nr:hypothetical protein PSENEW3_00002528 [Picochlorum sp. SENEW3]
MRTAQVTSLCLAALLAAGGQVALADTMVGGNGLCADPASLGPNAPVGGYAPVEDPQKNIDVEEIARLAAIDYLFTPAAQTPEDTEILKQCGANRVKLVDSIDIIAACSQVVQGTNYLVEFTITVPCSDANKKILPPGVNLTRTIRAEGYVALPEDGKNPIPELTGVQGVSPQDDFCGQAGLAGGFNDVTDPSDNEQVVASAKLAAQSYWENDQSDDFKKAVQACGATENDFVNSVQITQACSQVVAGTNYRVQFAATIPCPTGNTQDIPEGFLLKRGFIAEVFQPLPNSNEAPKVEAVKDTGGLLGGSTITPDGVVLEGDGMSNVADTVGDTVADVAEQASGATGVALGTTGLAVAGLVLMFA